MSILSILKSYDVLGLIFEKIDITDMVNMLIIMPRFKKHVKQHPVKYSYFADMYMEYSNINCRILRTVGKYTSDDFIIELIRKNGPEKLNLTPVQTEQLCLRAVSVNICCIQYVTAPTPKIWKYVLQREPRYIILYIRGGGNDYNLLEMVVKLDPNFICHIPVELQNDDLRLLAVSISGGTLVYMDVTPELANAALKNSASALQFVPIKMQTAEMCIDAVRRDGNMLKYCRVKTYDICHAAVKKTGSAIQHVPLEYQNDLQLLAVMSDIHAYDHITNPHPATKMEYVMKRSFGQFY